MNLVHTFLAFQAIVFLGLTQYCYLEDQFDSIYSGPCTQVIEQEKVSGCTVLLTQLAHGTVDATSNAPLG